ncbi:GSCOCG00007056001-RA-CDS [Cotesia congregata]|nr:GSCOCG00007056001-RA-CDS [Cotesia congregata]
MLSSAGTVITLFNRGDGVAKPLSILPVLVCIHQSFNFIITVFTASQFNNVIRRIMIHWTWKLNALQKWN